MEREGDKLHALVGSDYGDVVKERYVDQVVINHGTIPLDEVYFELKPESSNLGEVEQADLLAGRRFFRREACGTLLLIFRIGDAVSARNTHAAIYDALRLCKDL